MSIFRAIIGDRAALACAATADYVYFGFPNGPDSYLYVTDKQLVFKTITTSEFPYPTTSIVAQDNQNVYAGVNATTRRVYYNLSTLALGQYFNTGTAPIKMSFDINNSTLLWVVNGNYSVYLVNINSYVPPGKFDYLYTAIKYAKNICCTDSHVCLGYDDRIEYYVYTPGTLTLAATIYQTGKYQFLYNQSKGYLYVATGTGIIAIKATGLASSPTLTIVDSKSGSFTGLATRGDLIVGLTASSTAYIYRIAYGKMYLIDTYTCTSNIRPTVCDVYNNDIFLCTLDEPVKLEIVGTPLGVTNQQTIY